MTAKEALHERVERLTDEDAARAVLLLDSFLPEDRPPVSAEEMAAVERAIARLDAGEGVPHSEVKRRLNLGR